MIKSGDLSHAQQESSEIGLRNFDIWSRYFFRAVVCRNPKHPLRQMGAFLAPINENQKGEKYMSTRNEGGKKLLCVLLTVLMLFCMIPSAAMLCGAAVMAVNSRRKHSTL